MNTSKKVQRTHVSSLNDYNNQQKIVPRDWCHRQMTASIPGIFGRPHEQKIQVEVAFVYFLLSMAHYAKKMAADGAQPFQGHGPFDDLAESCGPHLINPVNTVTYKWSLLEKAIFRFRTKNHECFVELITKQIDIVA